MKRVIGVCVVLLAAGVGAVAVYPERAAAVWTGALSLSGLGKGPDAAAPGGSGGGGGGKGGRAGQTATVVTATAGRQDFQIRRTAVGFLASPAVVAVNARVESAIVEVDARDGATVKAGDLLFRLDDRMLKAALAKDTATLARDQAVLDAAVRDLGRASDLAAKQAGTQQALDTARTAQLSAAATVEADKAAIEADRVQLSYTEIRAPIDGRLGAVAVAVGDLVGGGGSGATPLVTVTQMSPLEVGFALPEADLALARQALAAAGTEPNVEIRAAASDAPVARGRLDFVDSTVDTASGTVNVKAAVPNDDLALWPGQYVTVVLDAGTLPGAVSVPTTAVQAGQKGPFVYRVAAGDRVAVSPVTVALTDGATTAIADGLQPGDVVVTDGQTRLKDGATVRVAAAGGDPGGGTGLAPRGKAAGGAGAGASADAGKAGAP